MKGGKAGNGWVRSGNSWNGRGKSNKLVLVDLIAHAKREDENAIGLGVRDYTVESICVHVVLSVRKNDHDWHHSSLLPSSKVNEVLLSRDDTASNASSSSSLINSIHGVEERSLRVGHGNGESGIEAELGQAHSDLGRSKDVVLCEGTSEADFSSEIIRHNGSRFIEDQHEVDLLVAGGGRAVPSGEYAKSVRVSCSHIGEIHSLSVGENGSADGSCGYPNLANRITSSNVLEGAGLAVDIHSSTSRSAREVGHGVGPSLSLASGAMQVPQFLGIINQLYDGSSSNRPISSHLLSSTVVVDGSLHDSLNIGVVVGNDCGLEGAGGLTIHKTGQKAETHYGGQHPLQV